MFDRIDINGDGECVLAVDRDGERMVGGEFLDLSAAALAVRKQDLETLEEADEPLTSLKSLIRC